MIRKEAWPFYRTSSGVRLCCQLEEGPKGDIAHLVALVSGLGVGSQANAGLGSGFRV